MNNSFLAVEKANLSVESPVDQSAVLLEREGKLIRIIEAIQGVKGSSEWSTLKTEVFDSLATRLAKDLQGEAKLEAPDTLKLNRLAGQLMWAERYSDLQKLEDSFKGELTKLRLKLYGKYE